MMSLSRLRLLHWLGFRNIKRNWRHSIATTLAIAFGFVAITIFDGFLKELENQNQEGYAVRGMMGDAVVQKKDAQFHLKEDPWGYSLTQQEQSDLDEFLRTSWPGSLRVRFLSISGMITSGRNSAIYVGFGYDLKEGSLIRGKKWSWDTVAGKPLLQASPHALVVGQGLAQHLDCEKHLTGQKSPFRWEGGLIPEERPFRCPKTTAQVSSVTENGQVNALNLEISGIIDHGFRETDKRWVEVSLPEAQSLLDTKSVSLISVKIPRSEETNRFVKELQVYSRSKGYAWDVMPWSQHRMGKVMQGGFEILRTFRNIFMLVVAFIATMSIWNTMMKSVSERIREMGSLRSFGFLKSDLQIMIGFEGAYLSLIGCGLGFVLLLVSRALIDACQFSYRAGMLSSDYPVRVMFSVSAVATATVLLFLLAFGSSWVAARSATKINIADAMRWV